MNSGRASGLAIWLNLLGVEARLRASIVRLVPFVAPGIFIATKSESTCRLQCGALLQPDFRRVLPKTIRSGGWESGFSFCNSVWQLGRTNSN
jgi:hypothetical protein